MTKDKITIIGSGASGTAFGKVLYDAGNKNLTIYGIDKKQLADLKKGKNKSIFPKTKNLPNFSTSSNLELSLKNAKYVVNAIPTKAIDKTFKEILKYIDKDALLINVSKGFYPNTEITVHEGMLNILNKHMKKIRGIVSLLGPSFAKEMVNEIPTTVMAISKDQKLCTEIKELFSNKYFNVEVETDVKGAIACALYKNIIAIASGMIDGLNLGLNTRATILTKGFNEMRDFVQYFKGKNQTIMKVAGIGDLILTATSNLSRNFSFGKNFIKNRSSNSESKNTVEGVEALKIVNKIIEAKKIKLNIAKTLYEIIFKNKNPNLLVKKIWKDF